MSNRIISYGVEEETGLVYSRVGSEAAGPVLDFEAIGKGGGGFAPGDFHGPVNYTLQKMPLREVYPCVRWTKKIPVRVKNLHRAFWGFKPLLVPQDDTP